jgi:hypothetical protein
MLRKIVLRNTSLSIHDQVNQHHTRSTSCTTRNVAQHDWSCIGPLRNPATAETLKVPVLCRNPLRLAIRQQTYRCYGISIPSHRPTSIQSLLYVNQQAICIAKGQACLFSKCLVPSSHRQLQLSILYNHVIHWLATFTSHNIYKHNIRLFWLAVITLREIRSLSSSTRRSRLAFVGTCSVRQLVA